MDSETRRSRLQGCYVTIPTMFRDPDLEVDLDAIRRHVRFLIDGGLTTGNAVLLAGGAAGDFSTLSFDERVLIAEAVVDEAAGRVPIAMGGQTTSTREIVQLACIPPDDEPNKMLAVVKVVGAMLALVAIGAAVYVSGRRRAAQTM